MSDIPVPIPPAFNPFLQQQALRQPIRVTATPQLALGQGGGGVPMTLDDLAKQVVGGRPTSASPLPPEAIGNLPRVNELPTAPLGAPGPTGPIPPTLPPMGQIPSKAGTAGFHPETFPGVKSAAMGSVDDLLRTGGAAGAGGLLGKLGSAGKLAGKTRFGIAAAAPFLASMIAPKVGGSDSAAGKFITGAGLGASAGALSANPFVIGGAAILGGIANTILGGEGGPSANDRFQNVMDQVPFDDATKSEFQVMYEVLKETVGNDEEALKAVGQAILVEMTSQDNAQAAQAKLLATQALTAQFFQPFTQQLLDSAQQRAQIGERLAESLPENYRGIARMQNAAALDNATRTANAYAAQAQLLPAMASMQYQQGLAAQAAQQASQQGGGATSLTGLIDQLQPQTG